MIKRGVEPRHYPIQAHVCCLLILVSTACASQMQAQPVPRLNLDAEYSVLDKQTARDKYGKEIAESFYVVPVTVANADQKSVSLQFVRFKDGTAGRTIGTIPIDTVVQIYEKKKAKGPRARTQQFLKIGSLFLPSFDFFFKNSSARSLFAKSLNIYNVAHTSAFEAYPDYIQTYLQILRSNKIFVKSLELTPSSSDTVDVFVQKTEVSSSKDLNPIDAKTALGAVEIFAFASKSNDVDVVKTK